VPDEADRAKGAAARYAVERYARAGQRIALGTGSTAAYAVRALAEHFPAEGLDLVASSTATEDLARGLGLTVRPLRGDDRFDRMFDGADEVAPSLDLTKGGGGALFREKFLARLADEVVILVDPSKLVDALGMRHRVPVEVVPFARPVVEREVARRGYRPHLRADADRQPYRTDNGNEILDLAPAEPIRDPAAAEHALREIPGVVETGLFVGLAHRVIIGHPDGRIEERVRATVPTPGPYRAVPE
jgi:ribose 5-phosphate isomerase A